MREGAEHNGAVCKRLVPIPELALTFRELKHTRLGARIIHLEANDPENLFAIALQTLPTDSTGVAHILEHTVLCGSERYRVKDPFFSMHRRSLSTFMNAFTGADFTCYPAASQVPEDFYNLLDVYLDAVFFPLLDVRSFRQEGHRLEFEQPDDPKSPLVRRGIVYNEMKGSMSNPESRLWQELSSTLMPDLTYAYNSGGDPKVIPDLTHEGLKAFHATSYHPSRAIFYFYGDLPIERHLDRLEERLFQHATPLPQVSPLLLQPKFTEPKRKTASYPLSGGSAERKSYVTLSWLTAPIRNHDELLALSVIDTALMETDASPLKAALLASGLCSDADSLLDTEMSEAPYAIICRGCEEGSSEAIEAIILETLEGIVQGGIESEAIEAAITNLAFDRSEITGGSHPFGLTLCFRAVLAMQHGAPPEEALLIRKPVESLRALAKRNGAFERVIEKYLLTNPHRVTLELNPDKDLEQREAAAERAELDRIAATLSPEQREAIVSDAAELVAFQEAPESLDVLPYLPLSAVERKIPRFPLKERGSVLVHTCFTNHIAYTDLLFGVPLIEG